MNIPTLLQPTEISGKYARNPGPYKIGYFDLDRIFPGIMRIEYDPKKYGKPEFGETNETETELIFRIVKWLEPKILVDFGTFYGRSALIMAEQSPLDAKVITVDLPDQERQRRIPKSITDLIYLRLNKYKIGEKYENYPNKEKIRAFRTDATSKEFWNSLDGILQNNRIDFALIDATHDYDTSKMLFDSTVQRMNHGGIILTDDYGKLLTHIGLVKFVDTLARTKGLIFYHFAPVEAYEKLSIIERIYKRPSGLIFVNLGETKKKLEVPK